MSWLGLWAVLIPSLAFAGASQPPAPKDKPFSALYMGEGGTPANPGPEDSDARESGSRQTGTPGQPVAQPAPEVPAPPALPDGAQQPAPLPGPVAAHADPASVPAQARAAAPAPSAPAPRWLWPGPESPASSRRRADAVGAARREARDASVEDDLRDAPAPVAPERYSLWAGLSQPLLLSAARAREAAPDQAKALAETDYAAHILQAGGVRAPSSAAADAKSAAAPARESVRVELDVADHPGEWQAAADELAKAAGFTPDASAPPRFIGSDRRRVLVTGTVTADRSAALLSVARVRRVESSFGAPAAPAEAQTRILMGLRLPPAGSPQALLESVTSRLAEAASFRVERPVALQRIPGTNQMVLVVQGRLPVRSLGALMQDPAVVKVAPYPGDEAAAKPASRAPAWRSLLHDAVSGHPAVLLAVVLVLMSLSGPFYQRASARRRA